MTIKKLDASIPANNWKIIELYNKIKKEELDPSPDFQRKLVWKKSHKYKFIETIIMNFPFPEIYIAPGELNTESLTLKDLIVDGQQRCTTIIDYIEDKGTFALSRLPIKKFSELSQQEKQDFLNYEVSIRYMKNANKEQIKEIFQRINSTEYSLNKSERLHAQWGDSEFILFAKQIIERDELNYDIIFYRLGDDNSLKLSNFFIKYVFSENDIKRMLALQYLLTLITTIIKDSYFSRNNDVQDCIEQYNEEFLDASDVEITLVEVVNLINELELNEKSYWFNKANLFSLIVELSKYELSSIQIDIFKEKLLIIEEKSKLFNRDPEQISDSRLLKYFEYAKEAVNETKAREYRGDYIRNLFDNNSKQGFLETS